MLWCGKDYENVFFTSDEHYGSERAIELSRRLPFIHNGKFDTELMDATLIKNHNSVVSDKDLVFHLGDFGNRENVKKLNGDHVLLLGNYEVCEISSSINTDTYIQSLRDAGFIAPYFGSLTSFVLNQSVTSELFDELKNISLYMTHKPSECIRDDEFNKHKILNLFGHIHEKRKVTRYGLNVGVDGNFFFPYSSKDVEFYLNAILHHYDDEVFI